MKSDSLRLAEWNITKINERKEELGRLIENAKSEKEADAIFKVMSHELSDKEASDIWDYSVDWTAVKWKEKRREVV